MEDAAFPRLRFTSSQGVSNTLGSDSITYYQRALMRTKNSLVDRNSDSPRVAKIIPQEKSTGPRRGSIVPHKPVTPILTDEELLNLYLDLPRKERNAMFADTASAAELVGLSQRTIQFWIEIGLIRAVFLGGKYKISLPSLKSYLIRRNEQQAN
jgi:excisionase family DNA binding protein